MDDRRFDELYRTYGRVIFARCRRLLGSDALAQDATQETFLRVLGHLEAAPDSQEAIRWVYRIATNHCLNLMRDERRRARALEGVPSLPIVDSEQRIADRRLVEQLLEHLPRKLAATAWLYHVDGLEHAEVARTLGISKRSVANYLTQFARSAAKFARRASE